MKTRPADKVGGAPRSGHNVRKLRENWCGLRGQTAKNCSALVEEDLGMLAAPHSAALPIFPDDDAEPHAGATVAVLAGDAQAQHAIAQFVAHHCDRRRRSGHRRPAILRRNDDPGAVRALLIATPLIVAVA